MRLICSILLAFCVVTVVGCATPYQPVGFKGGYSESEMGSDTYLVNFQGNGYTGMGTVQTYALRRAKELCTERGFSDFQASAPNGQTNVTLQGGYQTNCYGNSNYANCQTNGPTMVSRHNASVVVRCQGREPASTKTPAKSADCQNVCNDKQDNHLFKKGESFEGCLRDACR